MKYVLSLLLLVLASCELSEIVTEGSQDIVIAEVYLRTDQRSQTAWLHRTRQADNTTETVPGARIEVTNETTRAVLVYEPAPDSMCVVAPRSARGFTLGSCYTSNPAARFDIKPGQRYTLRITLPDGAELTGATTVPGDFEILRPRDPACSVPPRTRLEVQWTSSSGAWVYAAETHIHGLRRVLAEQGIEIEEEPLRLFGLSISNTDTTIVFPAEFGLFDRFNSDLTEALAAIQVGLPPGTHADVVVAATDRNYVNWERGGNFNPSGLVRISSIRGDGAGAFGSLVLKSFQIHVGEDSLPGC